MRIDLSAVSLQLPRGAAVRLRAVPGLVVCGRAGRLWLTEEGVLADVFLHAAERYVVAGSGRVVIGAEQDATLVLQAAEARRPIEAGAWVRAAIGRLAAGAGRRSGRVGAGPRLAGIG